MRGPADELLPKGLGAAGRGQALEGKGRLEADRVEEVPDPASDAGSGDEDLERVSAPRLEPFDPAFDRLERQELDAINLAGIAAPDKLFDLEPGPGPAVGDDAADLVLEDGLRLVAPDTERTE